MPTPIVAVCQQKGGVGKSTICANLAVELATSGTVVALDLDPQRTLTDWATKCGEGGKLRELVRPVSVTGPDKVTVFRRAVQEAQQTANVVLLDCPAGVAEIGMLAALSADVVLVPVTPSPADLLALVESLSLLRETQRARGGKPIIALVPSRISRTSLGAGLPETLAQYGETVLPGIGNRIACANSILDGLALREALSQKDPGVVEFSTLAAEVARIARSA